MRVEHRTTFVLPGRWWTLKTAGSETQMVAAIKAEVERTVGRSDDRASLRREVRTQLLDAAHEARRLGADRLYIAEEITAGVPFSASLTVVKPDLEPLMQGTLENRRSELASLAPNSSRPELCDFVEFPLARTVSISHQESTESAPTLQVDYLLASPYTGDVLIFAFATAFVSLHEEVVELFDAILSTVSFPEPATTELPA